MLLDGIDLRYLRIGSTELVRRVYTAVRDADWDTVPPVISGLEVDERAGTFRVEFAARHVSSDIDFSWLGTITGESTGRVEYVFDGHAKKPCRYGRIGICVHHPWRETAGAGFTARTPDGDLSGAFPDLIGPQALVDGLYQPLFPAFDGLEIELAAGGRLRFEFEGDLWEVEDHRNWTDANFKTYSTPLSLGAPAPLQPGQSLRQRVVITPIDVPIDSPSRGPIRLTLGAPTGARVPPVGVGADRDAHVPDAREASLLAALGPAHLRIEVRLRDEDWLEVLAAGQETARRIGSSLELALMLRAEDAPRLPDLGEKLAGGPNVDRVIVTVAGGRTGTNEETTPAELVRLVRRALTPVLPDAQFGGGTEIYFTEINRTRPDPADWDCLCYSITPQIHAFTDTDVMENLDAQAETVRSAQTFSAGKAVIVSPITMRRRVNFHAAGDPPPTPPGELPDSVDVRQSSLLGGAWTAGSLKYLSESGAGAVTYYESTGRRGVLERAGGAAGGPLFRSRPGEAFPLYHPLADAIEWQRAAVLECRSSDVLVAVGHAVQTDDGAIRLLLANLTPAEQPIVIGPLEGAVALRRLNEATVDAAALDPEGFRRRSEAETATGELNLSLRPYEVVRIDPA